MNYDKEIKKHERALDILHDLKVYSKTIKGLNDSKRNFKNTFGYESQNIVRMLKVDEAEFKKLIAEYEAIK